jgi:hypothetical protein
MFPLLADSLWTQSWLCCSKFAVVQGITIVCVGPRLGCRCTIGTLPSILTNFRRPQRAFALPFRRKDAGCGEEAQQGSLPRLNQCMEGWWRVLKITTERNVCSKKSLIEVARPQLLRPAQARAPHRIIASSVTASPGWTIQHKARTASGWPTPRVSRGGAQRRGSHPFISTL